MSRKITQQDLDVAIRASLQSAGQTEPASLGEVLNKLPDSRAALRWSAPSFRRLAPYVAIGLVVVTAGAALGLPMALSKPTVSPSASLFTSPSGLPTSAFPGRSGSFVQTGSMHEADNGQTATRLLDGRVLVTPGGGSGGATVSLPEINDPRTGRFTQTTPMAQVTVAPDATLLADGRVLITGGCVTTATEATFLRTAEIYDPTTNTFTATGSMNFPRCGHTATLLQSGQVLVAGADQLGGTTAELYDPSTGKFTLTGSAAIWRITSTATRLPDGRVLIAGGNTHSRRLVEAELYDPATGAFTQTGQMAIPRAGHTATLLKDGRVLIAGGEVYVGPGSARSAEIYDPTSGTFSPTGSLTDVRMLHVAVLLADGTVLLAGGIGENGFLATAELYNPGSGTFTAIGNMTKVRRQPAAALLADGRVLVTGGDIEGSGVAASAELYVPDGWSP